MQKGLWIGSFLVVTLVAIGACGTSADRGHIVYVTCTTDEKCALISVDPEGDNPTTLLTLADVEGLPPLLPQCSPDGNDVAFFLIREEKSSIFKANLVSGEIVDLTPAVNAVDPAWSPDGSKIIFSDTASEAGVPQLWIMNADGSDPHHLAPDGPLGLVASWSPDGREIAYTSSTEVATGDLADIWAIGVDGSNRRRLITGLSNDRQPVWSPDGQTLAFTRVGESADGPSRPGLGGQIFVADASGENVRSVTSGPPLKFLPRWSPDGKQIAFSVAPGRGEKLGQRDARMQIYVINPDGSGERQISDEPNGAHFATWCP
jgi:Tol biopolymer transport system component